MKLGLGGKLKRTKIKFYQMEQRQIIQNGEWLFQWCCDCKLRHIWQFEIIRGKTPKDDFIILRGTDDRMATKLRREYERRYHANRR